VAFEGPLIERRSHVFGMDFSGAVDAGKRIWIAKGVLKRATLQIFDCIQACNLPHSGPRRESCFPALRELIGKQKNAAIGMDFPFSLPKDLVQQEHLIAFVVHFPDYYDDPDAFRQLCRSATRGKEIKRLTEIESRTPFSPYNLRLYKQTYYGITEILRPLTKNSQIAVLPVDLPYANRPWLLETCPASTLKVLGLYGKYKGHGGSRQAARAHILDKLMAFGHLRIDQKTLYHKIVENTGGDALDSVIAAYATFRALRDNAKPTKKCGKLASIEGYVYA
jgi:hypothetical protein